MEKFLSGKDLVNFLNNDKVEYSRKQSFIHYINFLSKAFKDKKPSRIKYLLDTTTKTYWEQCGPNSENPIFISFKEASIEGSKTLDYICEAIDIINKYPSENGVRNFYRTNTNFKETKEFIGEN